MTPTQPPEGDGRINLQLTPGTGAISEPHAQRKATINRYHAGNPSDQEIVSEVADEIRAGMLQWEPGSLTQAELGRVLVDALADVWFDCYRRDEPHAIRLARFRERITAATDIAIGHQRNMRPHR